MKKFLAAAILALCVITSSKGNVAADITPNYFIFKQAKYIQTSSAAPTQISGTGAYRIGTFMESASNGAILTGTLTASGGTGSPMVLESTGDTSGDFSGEKKFTDQASLDAAYNSGSFTLAGQTAHASYSTSMNVSGTFSSFNVPTFTSFSNASWSGGVLQVSDSTAAITVNWSSSHVVTDGVLLMLQDGNGNPLSRTLLSGTATSYTLPVLTSGTYGLSLIYMAVSGSNSSAIPGATGYSGYGKQTDITILSGTTNGGGGGGGGGGADFYTDFSGLIPLWDLSGTYSGNIGSGLNLSFTLVELPSGKFTGNGTLNSDDGQGNVMGGNITLTGVLKGANNVATASLSILGTGTGTAMVSGTAQSTTFTGKIKFTCTVDGSNSQLVITGGAASAKETVTATGKNIGISTKIPAGATLALPDDVNSDWNLTQNLTATGTKVTGTATAQTSPGDTVGFTASGSYSSITNLAKIALKGTGASLSVGMSVSGSNATILSVKGKLYGQSLNYTAP